MPIYGPSESLIKPIRYGEGKSPSKCITKTIIALAYSLITGFTDVIVDNPYAPVFVNKTNNPNVTKT